jgi:hypothetical protein
MARQLTFSDLTDQRTLTESANAATDDTPRDTDGPAQPSTTACSERRHRAFPSPAGRSNRLGSLTPRATTGRRHEVRPDNGGNHDHANLEGLRTTRVETIQCDRPARTDSRMAVPRVRRSRPQSNVHPLDRPPRHLTPLRTLHYTQVVACVRGLRRSHYPISTLENRPQLRTVLL